MMEHPDKPRSIPEDSSSTSIQSHKSPKFKSHPMSQQLMDNIQKQINKNQAKYHKVIKEHPQFNINLYKPKIYKHQNPNPQVLSMQLDRLLEDEYTLDKELSKIQINNQDEEQMATLHTNLKMDHYSFLRNCWKKPVEGGSPEERITSINIKVASIKNHIKHMAKIQSEHHHEETNLIKNSKQYSDVLKKLQILQQEHEKQAAEWRSMRAQLEQKIGQLTATNSKYMGRIDEQTEKRKKQDKQIVSLKQKIHSLEFTILKMSKELKKTQLQDKNVTEEGNTNTVEANILKVIGKDKSYVLTIQSDMVESYKEIQSSRFFTQIKSFLVKNNPLERLIQSGNNSFLPNVPEKANKNCEKNQNFPVYVPKRKMTQQKIDQNRTAITLGSQEKKRRFERTRVLE